MWIITLFSLALNYCLLYFIIACISNLFHQHNLTPAVSIMFSIAFTTLPTIIGISSYGQKIRGYYLNLRNPTKDELNLLNPLIGNAMHKLNQIITTNSYNKSKVQNLNSLQNNSQINLVKKPNIILQDIAELKLSATGVNSLIISNLILANTHPQELQQRLLEQLYKLHYKYSIIIDSIYFSNWFILLMYQLLKHLQLNMPISELFYRSNTPLKILAIAVGIILLPLALITILWYKMIELTINYLSKYLDHKAYIACN